MTRSVEVDNTIGVGTDRKKVYNVTWKMTQNLKVRHNTLDVDTDCDNIDCDGWYIDCDGLWRPH